MKTKLMIFKGKAASTLLLTLFLMFILVMSIGGYMYFIEQQNKMGARSQAWNMAMALSEAGIEEGLEVLNSYNSTVCPIPSSQFTGSTGNGNNWTPVGTNSFSIQRSLPGGSYTVTVDMTDCYHPIITSWASVTPPALTSRRFFFAALTANTSSTQPAITRGVRVRAYKGSIWVASLAARNSIGMSGNSSSALVNSFDDTLNGGVYSSASALSNAVVASLTGTVNAGNWNIDGNVEVGPTGSTYVGPNGSITGTISHDANFSLPDTSLPDYSSYLGPTIPGGTTTVEISPGSSSNTCSYVAPGTNQYVVTNIFFYTNNTPSSCGSYSVVTSNSIVNITGTNQVVVMTSSNLICDTVQQHGNTLPAVYCSYTQQGSGGSASYKWYNIAGTNVTYITNPVVTYVTNTFPIYAQTNYTLTTNPIWQTNNYDHIICGTYYINDASALGGNTVVTCPSTVVALNGVQLSGHDQIYIAPNASLQLYSSGSVALDGNGVINTNPGVAESFQLICTTNVTTVDIGGNGQFTGTVLAPDATVKMNGGGSAFYNVIGAIMANNITMQGHMAFHYPESLSRAPSALRYVVQDWKELDH